MAVSEHAYVRPDLAEHFTSGVASGRGEAAEPSSLDEDSAKYNAEVPRAYRPDSTLAQVTLSANGSSAIDAARQMPDGQFLPTSNGASEKTNSSEMPLRLVGSRPL